MYKDELPDLSKVAGSVPSVGPKATLLDGQQVGSKIPVVKGYKILIIVPSVEEKIGSIYLTDERKNAEAVAAVVGFVHSMGSDCYKDLKRFPSGEPYCKPGDWVLFRSYSGTRLEINGQEFRIINDDTVEAVVQDPRGIKRAGAF